jgi:hypothetical protein
VALLGLAAALPVLAEMFVVAHPASTRGALLSTDSRQVADVEVAAWLRAHTSPSQQVYAFVAAADVYLLSGRSTDYPYLWGEAVQRVPGALPLLATYLRSDDAPRYVVMVQWPSDIDPTGMLQRAITDDYVDVATIGGFDVLSRRELPVGSSMSTAR